MSVLLIHDFEIIDEHCTVKAMVEDAVLLHLPMDEGPAEYGPGICRASFYVDPEEEIPCNEDALCSYLDSLNLDWRLVEVDNGWNQSISNLDD
jgi:hypothetical protein